MSDIVWTCDKCGGVNIDSYEETTFPVCGDCGFQFDWGEILTPEQIFDYNAKMAERDEEE